MAFTTDDFNKVWASTSPLTPYDFSESNYKEGWNFVGATPPARQMWDSIQKSNDEKSNWLYTAHNDLVDLLKTLIPTGCVQAFAGSTLPDGWLLCDGSAVSRTTYARLFEVIGTTYGAGNGSSTFNLPNLTDKFIQGSTTAGTVKSAGLPNITGETNSTFAVGGGNTGCSGAVSKVTTQGSGAFQIGTGGTSKGFEFDASASNSIYGNSTTVQPPALTMRYIIKY